MTVTTNVPPVVRSRRRLMRFVLSGTAMAVQSAFAVDCDPGSFSATGQQPCVLAPVGSFVAVAAASAATQAPVGSFVNITGATAVTLATPGFFVSVSGATAATQASPGSFVSVSGATAATQAPVGTFVNVSAATAATPAPAGSFVGVPGATAAVPAPAGTFVNVAGASAATQAPVGSFVNITGATAVTLATPGFFVSVVGATAATQAPVGSFVSITGATVATLASPGFFVSVVGATAATQASPGSFVSVPGATAATLAPPGFFVQIAGATVAQTATHGFLAGVFGATEQAMLNDGAAGSARSVLGLNAQTLQIAADLVSQRSIVLSGAGGTVETGANLAELSGVISGSGGFTKAGSGVLTLSGVNTFAGGTNIIAGTLQVTGSVPGEVLVGGAGKLGGTGTVGSIRTNGTVAPGASIGTLNVSGNYVANAGSTLEIEVNAAGGSDRLQVGGTATLGGALKYIILPGSYTKGTNYTFLSATGGVSGRFDSQSIVDEVRLAGLTITTTYGANSVAGLIEEARFGQIASTPQTGPLASLLDAKRGSATGDLLNVINLLSVLPPDRLAAALNQLNAQGSGIRIPTGAIGTVDGNTSTMLTSRDGYWRSGGSASGPTRISGTQGLMFASAGNTDALRTTQIDASRAVLPLPADTGRVVWGGVVRNRGGIDSNGERTGASFDLPGLVIGGDARVGPDTIAGASGTAVSGSINYSGGLGSAKADDYRIDLYGQQRFEALTIDVILSAGLARYDQSRAITIPGLTRIARGEFNRHELGAMLRVARTFPIAETTTTSWSVRPSAGVAASMSRQDGYTESGAGALDLSVSGLKNSMVSGTLGIDLRGRIESGGAQWLPYGGFSASRRLTYGDSSITQTLPSLGTFSVPAYLEPLTTYTLRIGVDVRFNRTSSAYLELSDSHGQGTSGQTAMAGARIHW